MNLQTQRLTVHGACGDIEALRDMLRGTTPGLPAESSYARVVRSANHFNY